MSVLIGLCHGDALKSVCFMDPPNTEYGAMKTSNVQYKTIYVNKIDLVTIQSGEELPIIIIFGSCQQKETKYLQTIFQKVLQNFNSSSRRLDDEANK